MQLLSEPSGGSDMAGALTRAIKDDDIFILNGAKVWSTGAHVADYGLLLARTDPELSKHRGLSMFIVPLDAEGVTVNPIRLATGASEFCEEFFDDVKIPAGNLVGQLNDGWSVASRLLFHERSMVGDSGMNDSRYTPAAEERSDPLVSMVQQLGVGSDPLVRQLLGEALTLTHVKRPAVEHISEGLALRTVPGSGGQPAQTAQLAHRVSPAGDRDGDCR